MTTALPEPAQSRLAASPLAEVAFAASRRIDGAADVLVLGGELCRVTRQRLALALRDAVAATRSELVVDVTGVTFVDAGAINEIVLASRALTARGSQFWLTGTSAMFHRLLEIVDLVRLERTQGGKEGAAIERGAHALGAALRRIAHERQVSRTEARMILARGASEDGRPLSELAVRVAEGAIPVASLPVAADGRDHPPDELSDAIRRRLDRSYVVLRVGQRLDHAAAVEIERSLTEGTDNADVVLDLRDCASGSADGLRVLLRLRDDLARTRSTLTLREPPLAFVGSIHDADLLGRFTVSQEPVPRRRSSGGADPKRR